MNDLSDLKYRNEILGYKKSDSSHNRNEELFQNSKKFGYNNIIDQTNIIKLDNIVIQEIKLLFVWKDLVSVTSCVMGIATNREKAIEQIIKNFKRDEELQKRNKLYWKNILQKYNTTHKRLKRKCHKLTGHSYYKLIKNSPQRMCNRKSRITVEELERKLTLIEPLVFPVNDNATFYML